MKRTTMHRIMVCMAVFVLALAGWSMGKKAQAADVTPPTIKGLSAGVSGDDAKVYGAVLGSEAGTFYYVVLPQSYEIDMTIDYIIKAVANKTTGVVGSAVGSGTVDGMNATSFELKGLLPNTKYLLYAYMMDLAGNRTDRPYQSAMFKTNTIAISGTVEVIGQDRMAVDSTVKAGVTFHSEELGVVSYQWYRIALTDDQKKIEDPYDETGGAAEDILVAHVDEDDLALNGSIVETGGIKRKKAAATTYTEVSLENATPIEGEDSSTYKIKKEDVGYRLVVRVTASNYRSNLMGYTNTFVPKILPEFELPQLELRTYSADRTLANVALPENWSWVDKSIVPVAETNGYRALYTPTDSQYRKVIVRVDVPLERKTLTDSMIMVLDRSYTGQRITDNFEVADEGNVLKCGRDYIVTYKNNLNVGTATVTFKGVGNYKGTVSEKYKITKCPISNLIFTYTGKVQYSGRKQYADLAVENGAVLLKKNQDYTVTYKNNKNVGKASIVVRGFGNYSGKKTLRFTIIPKKASLTVAKQSRSFVKLKFGDVKGISGYTLYFAKDEDFTKGLQKFNTSKHSMILRGMDRGKFYYLRLRTFKIVNGERISSKFSQTKKVWVY